MARFARIAWGLLNWTLFLRIAFRGTKGCESQVWGDSGESLERYENRFLFLRVDCLESPRFALQIAGPSLRNGWVSSFDSGEKETTKTSDWRCRVERQQHMMFTRLHQPQHMFKPGENVSCNIDSVVARSELPERSRRGGSDQANGAKALHNKC